MTGYNSTMRIKELRKAAKLSQAYIAKELDITQPHYSNMEKGKREINARQLAAIAEILQVHPGELFAPLPNPLQQLPSPSLSAIAIEADARANAKRELIVVHIETKDGEMNFLLSQPQGSYLRDQLQYSLDDLHAQKDIQFQHS